MPVLQANLKIDKILQLKKETHGTIPKREGLQIGQKQTERTEMV
jgi:hypothetical protein